MQYSFPSDLARVVTERWTTFVYRGEVAPPVLPEIQKLQELFEAIFFASLEREEGRLLRFTVCYSETNWVTREDGGSRVKVVPLLKSRALSAGELRSLASAAKPESTAIIVGPTPEIEPGGRLEIAGIMHIGSEFARARAGKSMVYERPPYALLIEVREPGELHVYQGKYKLAVLAAGEIHSPVVVSGIDFTPAADILNRGEQGFWSRITPPEHEPRQDWLNFRSIALLNTVLNIVNTMKNYAHGGTLLLVEPDVIERMPVKFKYAVNYDVNFLDDEFADFINARNAYMDAIHTAECTPGASQQNRKYELLVPLMEADRSLCDAAETFATFSCVDGALVMSASLRLVGFGAEILLEKAPPVKVYQVTGNPLLTDDSCEMDSESFGMRHRSAVRFVAATPGSVAFIVSQDGKVSFCWTSKGRIYLKRGVNTSNPNMVGA